MGVGIMRLKTLKHLVCSVWFFMLSIKKGKPESFFTVSPLSSFFLLLLGGHGTSV
jgi:hypothetical protein